MTVPVNGEHRRKVWERPSRMPHPNRMHRSGTNGERVLVSLRWQKRSNTFFLRSLAADDEKIRPVGQVSAWRHLQCF